MLSLPEMLFSFWRWCVRIHGHMDCKYQGLHTEIKTDQILSDLSRNPRIQLLFDTQM